MLCSYPGSASTKNAHVTVDAVYGFTDNTDEFTCLLTISIIACFWTWSVSDVQTSLNPDGNCSSLFWGCLFLLWILRQRCLFLCPDLLDHPPGLQIPDLKTKIGFPTRRFHLGVLHHGWLRLCLFLHSLTSLGLPWEIQDLCLMCLVGESLLIL